jgi:hypothetical protein
MMATNRLRTMWMRAPRIAAFRAGLLSACLLLLAGCTAAGIFPNEPLPPAPPGPPAPFPSVYPSALNEPDESRVLTEAERAETEANLAKLAKEREIRVRRRIEQVKK